MPLSQLGECSGWDQVVSQEAEFATFAVAFYAC